DAVPVHFLTEAAGAPLEVDDADGSVGDALPCPKTHLSGFGRFEETLLFSSRPGGEFRHEKRAAVSAAKLELERGPTSGRGSVAASKSWIQVDAEQIDVAGHFPVVEVREKAVVKQEPVGIGDAEEIGLFRDETDGDVAGETVEIEEVPRMRRETVGPRDERQRHLGERTVSLRGERGAPIRVEAVDPAMAL